MIASVAIAAAGVIGYAFTHTLPARVPPPESPIQIERPLVDILQADKLSRTTTLLGAPEQPLAFAIIAPEEHVLLAHLRRTGWLAADKTAPRNMLRLVRKRLDYTTAPLAPAFWNGRVNDLAFERPVRLMQGNALATVRLWRTPFRMGRDRVFVGVAREYVGIRWGLLHTVSPDVDAAAERFVESLEAPGQPFTVCRQALVSPMIGTYLMGERFFTRVQMWLLDLGAGSDSARLCQTGRCISGAVRER